VVSRNPLTNPILLQRIEGGTALLVAVLLYAKLGDWWLLFIALILAPDVFMLGYLRGPVAGAAVYNLGHTGLLPGLLAAAGLLGNGRLAIAIALIWFAHIGVDRLLGYGLKFSTSFQDTHLGAIGRTPKAGSAT
jgi:uncharacterized protein DUF4260